MKKNEILKIYGEDFTAMTKALLEKADAESIILEKHDRHALIGIKPNLVSDSSPDMGATTHTEILEGIVEYLKEHGFDNLIILEGSWVGSKTADVYRICGYDRITKKYGVPFFDTQKDKYTPCECAGQTINICNKALELDFLVNVPVLKGHCQTRITCALKNMKGIIPNFEKRNFHTQGLHTPIARLNTAIHQDLIVIDNICGDLDFEDGGNPVARNCIMVALDPVLTDAYACKLLRRNVNDVAYIGLAEKLGIGSADLENAQIRTIRETDKWHDTLLPLSDKVLSVQDAVYEVDSCSACYGYLLPALWKLKDEGLLKKLDTEICIGQGYKGKGGKLGVGNCTSHFDYCVKGCPPVESEIYKGLKSYIANSRT